MAFDPISAALDIGGKLIDRLWPDPTQAAAAKLELVKLQQSGELASMTADTASDTSQAAIAAVEAASPSLFKSGWHPLCGWVAGLALAFQGVVAPVVRMCFAGAGYDIDIPPMDSTVNAVLVGMLGLSHVTRTFEKIKGVH